MYSFYVLSIVVAQLTDHQWPIDVIVPANNGDVQCLPFDYAQTRWPTSRKGSRPANRKTLAPWTVTHLLIGVRRTGAREIELAKCSPGADKRSHGNWWVHHTATTFRDNVRTERVAPGAHKLPGIRSLLKRPKRPNKMVPISHATDYVQRSGKRTCNKQWWMVAGMLCSTI